MNVLITGGAGFIGSHVAREAAYAGHKVLVLTKPENNLFRIKDLQGDLEIFPCTLEDEIQVKQKLQTWHPDTCIHLAWFAEPVNYLHSLQNINSLQNSLALIRLLGECGCEQFIGAGTCAEYQMKSGQLSETDRTEPETLYAASKLSFLLLGTQITSQIGMRFAWGRIFHVYGPYEDRRRLVPSAIVNLNNNQGFQTSPGEQVRDYLHVADVARAFLVLAEKEATGVYNICSSIPITLRFILEQIEIVTGKTEMIEYGVVPYRTWEPMFICGKNAKLSDTGWFAKVNLTEGLREYTTWLQNH